MRVLYGVQATGQGHISRARAMAKALSDHAIEVSWLFSGRERQALFDMSPFGQFDHRQGLTFATEQGRIRYRQTLRNSKPVEFIQDVRQLDLEPYDIVVTDFEPVTAWAAKHQGKTCVGIGHQYAFGDDTPVSGDNVLSRTIMRTFAPVSLPLGLHWHHYADNVLPPILDLPDLPVLCGEHVVVYLPFEDQDAVTALLQRFPAHRFVQYVGRNQPGQHGNVVRKQASISGFKQDLSSCRAVVCNSGFELISECLQWGKPVLTKPLAGQMEQHSNALALQQLGYATVLEDIYEFDVGAWLESAHAGVKVCFPDVAEALAGWLAAGCVEQARDLSAKLWAQTKVETESRLVASRAA